MARTSTQDVRVKIQSSNKWLTYRPDGGEVGWRPETSSQAGESVRPAGKERKEEMKVKVNEQITAEVKITQTMVCPALTAYYTIDYLVDGICVHSATTGAIYGAPNPIEMLDRMYTYSEYHYQDMLNPDPEPTGDNAKGRTIRIGSSGGRPAWWEEKGKTHRQAIIDAVAQIVRD